MKKTEYLSLISGSTTEAELVGIRNAADTDSELSMADFAEIDKAIGKKAERLREEWAE